MVQTTISTTIMSEAALRITAPANLPTLVKIAFSRAAASGHLTYFQTQVELLNLGPLAFQLRFSPALASKPKAPKQDKDKDKDQPKKKPFNPFANPDPALSITKLPSPASHSLVLNKFAIVPEHFILITNDFKQQTHLLEPDDLEAAYSCIRAYDASSLELFVFFNSGPNSGASQPHRHLQLLPVNSMKIGLDQTTTDATTTTSSSSSPDHQGWEPLISRVQDKGSTNTSTSAKPPFQIFAAQLTPTTTPEDRHAAYIDLYRQAVAALTSHQQSQCPNPASSSSSSSSQSSILTRLDTPITGEAQISYNLAMTSRVMAIMPRLAEGSTLHDSETGKEIGKVELNGTVLAGTALVKNEAEWDALRKDPEILMGVLEKIGVPTSQGSKSSSSPSL